MKCPKCDYLGFETGDRCKNCGYDFSLLAAPQPEPADLALKPPAFESGPVADLWLDHLSDPSHEGRTEPASGTPVEPSFPLFPGVGDDDDAPLIRLPAEPRAPLAVRRAPDHSRSRPAPRVPRSVDGGLTLEFAEEPHEAASPITAASLPAPVPPATASRTRGSTVVAGLGSRAAAALIDHAILLGIDALVVVCTLRIAALTMGEWQALPAAPLLAFLGLLKLAYFSAFTAMGGQTIGKMAAGIRVVADDHLRLDPARAIRRSLTGAVSLLSLGLGLIPALVNPERRALHDRVAHTRVVDLPSA